MSFVCQLMSPCCLDITGSYLANLDFEQMNNLQPPAILQINVDIIDSLEGISKLDLDEFDVIHLIANDLNLKGIEEARKINNLVIWADQIKNSEKLTETSVGSLDIHCLNFDLSLLIKMKDLQILTINKDQFKVIKYYLRKSFKLKSIFLSDNKGYPLNYQLISAPKLRINFAIREIQKIILRIKIKTLWCKFFYDQEGINRASLFFTIN